MQRIHPQITVSGIDAVRQNSVERDRVITVCQDNVIDNVNCAYEWYNMSDGPANSYGGDSSYRLFQQASDSLLRALNNGEDVLVHCHVGRSRSPSVAIAAMAVYEDMDYHKAYRKVKDQRPQIDPDSQLRKYTRLFIRENNE